MTNNSSEIQKFDFIIVGQGLAGTCLAMQLMLAKQRVLIIDDYQQESSSQAAAGLFNPITGRKMVQTWNVHALFPYLFRFYPQMEALLGGKFFHQRPIYRPFSDHEHTNDWMGNSATDHTSEWVTSIAMSSQFTYLNDAFGGIMLRYSGYVDIPEFLRLAKKYFLAQHSLSVSTFVSDQLILQDGGLRYQGYEAKKIIFCRGVHENSTFFEGLPFKPVKGELLKVAFGEPIDENVVYNKGVFAVHRGEGLFWVGATYHHEPLNWEVSEKAKLELTEKLDKMVKVDYTITGQIAGIRPATRDRKPFVGLHPHHPQIGIFNGLGAKGVSLAPWYSHQFAEYLINSTPFDQNVSIERYIR
jgi:glycine oxidase